MDYILKFAYPWVLYGTIPLLILIAWLRLKTKGARYRYPLTSTIAHNNLASHHPYKKIIYAIRLSFLSLLMFLMAKPQLVDPRTKITVEGIDIVLVLDISGSMSIPHHSEDNRSRIAVAKEEAVRFIDKRTNDAIGIVVFGADALSRCPLTVDKTVLKQIINDVDIGLVNAEGTVLSKSIVTAANRLRRSKSKSKIIILLTDGEPSEHDIDPKIAIEAAKQLGIKIYTVGIGDNQEIVVNHPFFGPRMMRTTLNKPLLTTIAHETGGQFFEAKNASEMRAIYDTIDRLERTEIEAPIFSHRYDWFLPFLLLASILLLIELFVTSFMWFGI